jgi:hypothetical protein
MAVSSSDRIEKGLFQAQVQQAEGALERCN